MAKPVHYCNAAGCFELIPYDQTYCQKHIKRRKWKRFRKYKRTEGQLQRKRFYHTAAWKHLSRSVLLSEPLCRECKKQGRTVMATQVDHIIPLQEDWSKRLDRDNLEPLCQACHSAKTMREINSRKK